MDSLPKEMKDENDNEKDTSEQPTEEQAHLKEHQSLPVGNSQANRSTIAELDMDDTPFLCGKPFFDIVLAKSHVTPHYNLQLPARIVRELPRATVPAVLRYKRKNWNLSYVGNCSGPRFDSRWREFVNDCHLKVGDACVFELLENSPTFIKFKVHILRGDLPPELQAAVENHGSVDYPIVVD